MNKILVTFNADWADEFDVDGFYIYEKDEWKKDVEAFKLACKHGNIKDSYYFGTNEGWEDFGEEWLDNYSSEELTNEQVKTLSELFNHGFGIFPHLNNLLTNNKNY